MTPDIPGPTPSVSTGLACERENRNMRFRRPRRMDLVVALATLGSVGALLAGLLLTSDGVGAWGAGVLVNLGASVLLVVPIYLLNQRLDQRIERVRTETRSSVEALTDRVVGFEADVERRLDDVAAAVSSRLDEEHHRDIEAFDALIEAPAWQATYRALRRADEMRLISEYRGPRMLVADSWHIYVRVDFEVGNDESDACLYFRVERLHGDVVDSIAWRMDQTVEDAMVRVGRAVQRVAPKVDLDVKGFFGELRELLLVALTDPDRRPIQQLCPPQWAVTGYGVVTYGNNPLYSLSTHELNKQKDLMAHVGAKPWVEYNSFHLACEVACALHEQDRIPEV